MPIYWADYFADTLHLTTIEHGAYLLLIGAYWRRGEPLPDDDKFLAQVTKIGSKRWKKIRVVVSKYFILKDGVWIHKRLEKEILRSNARSASAQRAGNASATARQQVTVTVTDTKKESKKKETGKILLPDNWTPNEGHYELAAKKGLSREEVDDAADTMRGWSIGGENKRRNWDWVFRNWLKRNANKSFTGNNGNGYNRPQTLKERTADALQRLGSGTFGETLDFGLPKLGSN